jgi:hypothetical protein
LNNVAQKRGNVKVLTKNTKIENLVNVYNKVARPMLIGLSLLALGGLRATSASAQASNVYITADGGGSGVCTNNTHPPSWFNNSGNWGSGSTQIGPGTVVHLCGSFNDSTPNDTLLTFQGSGTSGHPVTLLFESGTTLTNTNYWGDYSGAILSDGKSYITVDGGTNGLIQNTGNGTAFPNKHDTKGLVVRSCSANCVVKNLHVDNLYVHIPGTSSSSAGEDGPSPSGIATGIECAACSNSVLGPNNEAHDDFAGIAYNWEQTSGRNMEIYGNTVSRNNWGILAAGVSGGIDGLRIHDNDISDAFPWDDWADGNHHNGIFVFEVGSGSTISNLQQYNNYIHGNMGNICTGGLNHATAFLFNDLNGGTWVAPLTFNNVFVNTNPNCGAANGFATLVSNSGVGGVYNNTFSGRGAAISVTGTLIIKNNLIAKTDIGISNGGGMIASADYNLYYGLTGLNQAPSAVMIDHHSSINFYSSIAQWLSSSGFDSHGVANDPKLTSNFTLGTGSGAAGTATNLTSLGIAALNADRAGAPRPTSGAWDAGAYQISSKIATAPAPPTGVTAVIQ